MAAVRPETANQKLTLFLLLALLAVLVVINRDSAALLFRHWWIGELSSDDSANRLLIGPSSKIAGIYPVDLNEMTVFNYKSREEMFEIRTAAVLKHPGLADDQYTPNRLLGAIEAGKAWWGLYGIYFYGPGIRSIEGPSEESRFLLNPYLLVGVREVYAYIRNQEADTLAAFYPRPEGLWWRPAASTAGVRYDVGRHFVYLTNHGYPKSEDRELELVAYNARDFGLGYLWIAPEQSLNVTAPDTAGKAVSIQQYLHCGGSCGYPGGCNNMSPKQSDLYFRVPRLPATAYLKLWRKNPAHVQDPADITFVIEMF